MEKPYQIYHSTPIGKLVLIALPTNVLGIKFATKELEEVSKSEEQYSDTCIVLHILEKLKQELDGYFYSNKRSFSVPYNLEGTEFQRQVWHELTKINYGETRSYEDIAQSINRPHSVRAVGNAIGRNPVSILVPCHRVIRKDGSLGGYAGGVSSKRHLLELEGRV
jgi:methylated-DNA-[protein]-cysteine S-methyltransferase